METSNEKHFDDQIRKKLSNIESDAISWDEFVTTNQTELIAGKSLRRFLFSDIILLFLLSSYLLLNEYGFSSNPNITGQLINKPTTISNEKDNAFATEKSKASTINYNDQTDLTSANASEKNTIYESSSSDKQVLDSRNNIVMANNNNLKSNNGSSFKNNNIFGFLNNKNVKSKSNRKSKLISSKNKNLDLVSINDQNLDFLNTIGVSLFPANDLVSPDLLNKSIIDLAVSNPGIFPISVEVYGVFNHDKTTVLNNLHDFNVENFSHKYFSNNGIGIGLRYLLGKHFSLQTGVEYLVSNSKLNYIISASEQGWMLDSITGYIISPFDPPIPITIYDSTFNVFTVKKKYEVSLQEKSITVPVYLVYRLRKDNWSLEAISGANVILNSTKKLNSSDHNEGSIALNAYLPKYSNEIRFSIYLGLSLARQISNNLELFTQPSFQFTTNEATTKESLTAIRNRYTGIKVGLRYQFTQK